MTRRDGIFESERSGRTPKVYHHASETARSTNPAGGEVPRHRYENKTPRPAHTPNGSLPLSEVTR
jgi:hypothetical protein